MKQRWLALALLAIVPIVPIARAQPCGTAPLQLQILGSSAVPTETRAGTALLVWVNGKARLLVDVGPGAAMRFLQAGANLNDVDAILLSDLRIERTADLATLLQLSSTTARTRPLPIHGPAGNRWMPSTVSFVRALFDPTRGVWRHLGDFLSPFSRTLFKLQPHDLRSRPPKLALPRENREETLPVLETKELRVLAFTTMHGQAPALIWRLEAQGKNLALGAEPVPESKVLEQFVRAVDLLVLPDAASGEPDAAKRTAALAGTARLARAVEAKQLLLTPRSRATIGHEQEASAAIRAHYSGTTVFANDLDCVTP